MKPPATLAQAVEELRQHNLAFEERAEFRWQSKLEKLRLRTEQQKKLNDARDAKKTGSRNVDG